ncbi:amidase [Noviherbaspirillum galbum]|uniref:amidase n=1 Tax=Noviherbaspirillum galbum TaxID=2709383 RepID=UPI0038B31585
MTRRQFLTVASLATGSLAVPSISARTAKESRQAAGLEEKSIAELQAMMRTGQASAVSLVRFYLQRIDAIDRRGKALRSVIELNPDALDLAAGLDEERRRQGPRGPLHGIPVLLKDNIATRDRMQTTAGSLALVGAKAPRDAFLVTRLRQAGAVILGKTNLSEWANIRSTRSTSGWSARGGLTRNPYAAERNTSGSSSGSAVAIAANLAAVAIGTETDGSIVSPSAMAALVGFKPTVGLVSRDGIVPISHSQDTAGPMARCVADAAAVLQVIAARDARDKATSGQPEAPPDFLAALDRNGMAGARLGFARNPFVTHPEVWKIAEQAVDKLEALGATVVEVEIPNVAKYADTELEVLLHELKADMNAYLAEFAQGAPVRSLEDIIAFNEKHHETEMPWFGQELFIQAQAKEGLDSPAYLAALENNRRYSCAEGIDKIMQEHQLDALVAPTGGPAWLTDLVNGDRDTGGFSTPAAVAGYPHVTVPAGQVSGLPIGLSFVGKAYAEATLIKLAYAFEQATRARRPPVL